MHDIVERTSNGVKMLIKYFHKVQTQIDQLTEVQKDLLVNASREKEKHVCEKEKCVLKELNKILN